MASHSGHWSNGLLAAMNDPQEVVYSDDIAVVLKDKYPKAMYHFLILPRERIQSLKSVNPSHLDTLKHMHKLGLEIAQRADKDLPFRLGYHAVPSMSQLHLHLISQDFNSPCLKTKKHWNSFTTKYFVDSQDIIKTISSDGKWNVDSEKYTNLLKKELRCHICDTPLSNLPALKSHIALHDLAAFKKSS